MITLNGMTWDHPRGYGPVEASVVPYEATSGVRIHWTKRSLKDFGDAPIRELASRFDLLVLDHPHMGVAAESACLLPLDPFLSAREWEELQTQTVGPSLSSYHYKEHQWALPIDAACQVASYRPDLITPAELPSTWPEVEELAASLEGSTRCIGMALCPTDCSCSFLTLTAQCGSPVIEGSRRFVDEEAGTSVLNKLRQLKTICHPKSIEWNPIHLHDYMAANDEIVYAPLSFGYTNYGREGFRSRRLASTSIPGTSNSLLGGAGIAVSATCPHPREAVDYAFWLMRASYQENEYTLNGGQPGHLAAWQSERNNTLTNHFFMQTLPSMERAFVRPRHAGWPDFQEYLGERIHAFLLGGESPARVLAELQSAYTASYTLSKKPS